MEEFAGRRRLFKKLCKRAHALIVRWEPHSSHQTVRHRAGDWSDWIGRGVDPLPGTLGFGRMSGYYEPEWEDESAYSALCALLFWHFVEIDSQGEMQPWPTSAPRLRCWRDVLAAADRVVAKVESERAAA